MIQIYSRYNVPGGLPFEFTQDSLTQQNFRDECDINNIINRLAKTGTLPCIDAAYEYADVSDMMSFEESANFIARTTELFDSLPSAFRKRLDNNPANLADYLLDPDNIDEAVSLGLIERPAQALDAFDSIPLGEPIGGVASEGDTPEVQPAASAG